MDAATPRFPMSLDAGNRRMTVLVLALVGVVLGVQMMLCRTFVDWVPLLTMASLLPTLGVCWALAPIGLAVDARTVRIERRAWHPIEIPIHDIMACERPPRLRMLGTVRVFGVGGFFGTFGLMWSRPLGRFWAYATRSAPSLLLRRYDALPVLVTPDDADAVVAALHRAGVPD